MVLTDQFSRYPEVEFTRSIAVTLVRERLKKIFATHGTLVPPAPERHINPDQQERLDGDIESEPQREPLQEPLREPPREPPQEPRKSKQKRISTFEKHLKEYTV